MHNRVWRVEQTIEAWGGPSALEKSGKYEQQTTYKVFKYAIKSARSVSFFIPA